MNLKVGMKIDILTPKEWELFHQLSLAVLEGDEASGLVLQDFLEEHQIPPELLGGSKNDSILMIVMKFYSGYNSINLPDKVTTLLQEAEAAAEKERVIRDTYVPQCICDGDDWWNCRAFKHKELDIYRVEYLGEFKLDE